LNDKDEIKEVLKEMTKINLEFEFSNRLKFSRKEGLDSLMKLLLE